MNKKKLVVKFRPILSIACCVHNMRNVFRKSVRGGHISAPCALLNKVSFHIRGSNNTIVVEDFCRLNNCSISVFGSNNTIRIGKWSNLSNVEFYLEDNNNEIVIGEHTAICGRTHLATIEGTKILIGRDCLFSSDIHFRTGDSHSILDMDSRRINKSADIVIGNHVWVGTKVTCLKGTHIADNSVIGACSLVSKCFDRSNCILAGNPAKIIKENINWSGTRVPVGEIAPDC